MNSIQAFSFLNLLVILPLSLPAQEVMFIEEQVATKYAKQLDVIIAHLEAGEVELANTAMIEPSSLVAYLLNSRGGSALAKNFSHEANETLKLMKAIRDKKGKFVPVLSNDTNYPLLLSFRTSESRFSGQNFAMAKDQIYLLPAVRPDFPWTVPDAEHGLPKRKGAQQDKATDNSGTGGF